MLADIEAKHCYSDDSDQAHSDKSECRPSFAFNCDRDKCHHDTMVSLSPSHLDELVFASEAVVD